MDFQHIVNARVGMSTRCDYSWMLSDVRFARRASRARVTSQDKQIEALNRTRGAHAARRNCNADARDATTVEKTFIAPTSTREASCSDRSGEHAPLDAAPHAPDCARAVTSDR
jgi:hypothetical protein